MLPLLDHLPEDIIIIIIGYLDIVDILVVRQTCRYLHAASYTRSIWLTVVNELGRRIPLPPSTVPQVADAIIPQAQLERTCMKALKLKRNLDSPEPVPTSCTLIKGARHIDKLQLVDDGRWLLALIDGEKLSLYYVGGISPRTAHGYPVIFQPAVRAAELSRSSGRGWHCGFEATLCGSELMIMLSWRNSNELVRIDLSSSFEITPRGQKRMKFEVLSTFDRVRESALTPCAIEKDLLVYPAQCGQIRIVNYRIWEEGVISTWHPSPTTAVAEGWSREDILAVKLLPPYVLVVKPTSFQFFSLPSLERSASRVQPDSSIRPGPVHHLPFCIDSAVICESWTSTLTSSSANPAPTSSVTPLSIFVRDVDNWVLVHYRLKPSSIEGPPYTFPPQIVEEISDLAFTPRDRHNTFAIGQTGARGLVQGSNALLGYTTPQLAVGPTVTNIAAHTPLRILEAANGVSIDEGTGKIAVGEADGDIWVFGFGFDDM